MKGGTMYFILEKTEVVKLLNSLKRVLNDKECRFIFRDMKDKNFTFCYLYGISIQYIKDTLSRLEVDDFRYAVENTNPNYKKELLYVFTKQVILTNAIGDEDVIQLYIKFSLDEKKKLIITISFHEAEHDFV